MKKEDLSVLSNDELMNTHKVKKINLIIIVISIVIMIITAIYNTIYNRVSVFTFLPLFFLPIFSIQWLKYNAIIKELKVRNLK
jgi:hypothetical protein